MAKDIPTGYTEYTPEIRMYYGHIPDMIPIQGVGLIDKDFRLSPAPFIDISTNFEYANDTITGYSYTINLQGTVTSLDLRAEEAPPGDDAWWAYESNYPNQSKNRNIGNLIDHINRIRKILTQNGGLLIVKDRSHRTILKASGGILRNFSINESKWTDTASYTATLEFNYVEFMGNNTNPVYSPDGPNNSFMESSSYPNSENDEIINAGLLNFKKYKLKKFEDGWKINFSKEGMNSWGYTDNNNRLGIEEENGDQKDLGFNNLTFTIDYQVSATGRQDFVYTNDAVPKVSPAWQQAKDFCQLRLNRQVKTLIQHTLASNKAPGQLDATCNPGTTPVADLYNPVLTGDGLLSGMNQVIGLDIIEYDVFNEKIDCNVSESEGTFSLSYKAIIKAKHTYKDNEPMFTTDNTTHTFSTSINTDNSSGTPIKTMSIKGKIQGLTPGGLIKHPDNLEMPATNSSLFLVRTPGKTKYEHALDCFKKICNYDFYNQGKIGNYGKRDLKPAFKEMLGIRDYLYPQTIGSKSPIDIEYNPDNTATVADPPHPSSFNISQNFSEGSIEYTVTYSNNGCDPEFRQVSIQTNEPVEVFATFSPPGSADIGKPCPIIQRLGTKTSKKITISITGLDLSTEGSYNIGTGYPTEKWSALGVFDCNCDDAYLPIDLPAIPPGAILTQKSYTHNPLDSTYSINLSYVVAGANCEYSICSATNFSPSS